MEIKKYTQVFALLKNTVAFRVAMSIFIILFGWGCMSFFVKIKEIPGENILEEKCFLVEALQLTAKDYPVNITGYGVARPISLMSLAPEISGKVVFVNPNLRQGGIISSGEILFKIDNLDYTVNLCEAEAKIEQCHTLITKLKNKQNIDICRVDILERNKALASFQFKQTQKLFEEHNIGTKLNVDHFEKNYNETCDFLDQILKTSLLYPAQINEIKSRLKTAEAKLLLARTNLRRCKILAPFYSRVTFSSIDVGEIVSIGQKIAVLADDSVLEIEVPLDSNDFKEWIQFETRTDTTGFSERAWFAKLKPVLCEIIWGENNSKHRWDGYLDRVSEFDKNSRTIKVIIKIDASVICEDKDSLPLVDGMFCIVNIPGKVIKNAYRLPRQVVNFDNQVYIFDKNNRLKTLSVKVIRTEGEHIFVNEGLNPSDVVVKTRLVNPMEGVLLEIDGELLQEDLV